MLPIGVGTTNEPEGGDLVTAKIRLVKPLGAGGMGSVWLADHEALHTQVVVKFIAADLAKNKDALARFEREAAAASQVKSPHVVQVLDHGLTEDGVPFIVMELLEGRDLAAHLEKFGRLRVEDVGEIVAQLCRALARAHERGIVHRDIKPHNIFLCDAGSGELFVKLLDFGIAKGAAVEKLDESTKTGTLVGSPYYMSPEQLVGAKDIDFRTDLWSVGVVAFEAMTGTRAFDGETVGALALRIHNDPLPLPSQRCDSLNPAVDRWFERACSRAVSERFQSAKEMADALLAAITGDPSRESMTSSGSALARSQGSMALANTAVDQSSPHLVDSNALSFAGVERSPVRSRKPRGALMIATVIAAGALAYGIVKLTKTDHGTQQPAASLVVPAAPSVSIATAEPTTSVMLAPPPIPTPSTPTASTSSRVILVHTAAHVASAAPSATVTASSTPPPAHTTRNEDDIK